MLSIIKQNAENIKQKNVNRDIRISIIRILATIGIVLCHILQEYGNPLANWLNVNVQIFLFMSGFLYGNKTIENKILWLKNRFIKILVPYYIFFAIALIAYIILKRELLSLSNIFTTFFCLQLFGKDITGLGHLWFIPLILLCYIITPILQVIRQKISENKKYWLLVLLIILIVHCLIIIPTINMRYITSLVIYIIGYFISLFYQKSKKIKRFSSIIITIIAILLVILEILMPIFISNTILYKIISFAIYYRNLFLGIAIFMILYNLIGRIRKNKFYYTNNILSTLDSYTFYIYLTHCIYILGPMSLLYITNNIIINYIITFAMITISSIILKNISSKVIDQLGKINIRRKEEIR